MRNIFIIISLFLILIILQSVHSDENHFKWSNISGDWKTIQDKNGSFLYELKGKYKKWNYNELVNYNSIASLDPIKEYDLYRFTFQVSNPVNSPVELMLFFSLKNFRDFYAFKYVIENAKNTEIQFISSKINDPLLKPTIKNNFKITVYQSKNYDFEYNKKYNIEIKIDKNKAELFINGKKEMEADAPGSLDSGKIGFSSRNAQLRVEDLKVLTGDKIVFEDDFSKNSIKRWTVRAKRVDKKD